MSKLKQTYNKVKYWLEKDIKYRDNDELLVVQIWFQELKLKGINPHNITAFNFFNDYYKEHKLTPADEITRCRRKCNENLEHTRGKSYKPRKKKEQEMREEIKTIN